MIAIAFMSVCFYVCVCVCISVVVVACFVSVLFSLTAKIEDNRSAN